MAGFFAFIYGAFMLGGSAINSSKIESEKIESKKKAVEEKRLTYLVRGEEFFTENDLPCMTTINYSNGHKVIKAINTDKILYDYDAIELNQHKNEIDLVCEKARRENKKYIHFYLPVEINKPNGFTGIEVETGKKYYMYKFFETDAYYLQYLENEPTMVYQSNGYVSVYKFEGNYVEISKNEYRERRQL